MSTVSNPGGLPTIDSIDAPLEVLILCTGNICRSPMAEGLLRQRLAERGIDAVVSSAGLSFDDRAATDEAIEAAAAYGADITAHRSRVMSEAMLQSADLVLAMERLHAREAVVLGDGVLARTFTLKELVRRGSAIGPRRADESVAGWLARAGVGRRPTELMGSSADDDVADPFHCSRDVYSRCVAEIDDLVRRLTDLLWPQAEEGVA